MGWDVNVHVNLLMMVDATHHLGLGTIWGGIYIRSIYLQTVLGHVTHDSAGVLIGWGGIYIY